MGIGEFSPINIEMDGDVHEKANDVENIIIVARTQTTGKTSLFFYLTKKKTVKLKSPENATTY